MRKLDLKNYVFNTPDQKGVLQFITYDFHKSLEGMLTHPNLGLNGPELLSAMEIVEKVQKFLKRIFNCPSVPDEKEKIVKFSDNGKERKGGK